MMDDGQVGDKGKPKKKLFGVRAILGVRSRVFQEMLYGISTVFGSPQVMPLTIGKKLVEGSEDYSLLHARSLIDVLIV